MSQGGSRESRWYDLHVLTQPLGRLCQVCGPSLDWRAVGAGYRARNDAETQSRWGVAARRVEAKPGPSGMTVGPVIHGDGSGGGSARVVTWLELFVGVAPHKEAYRRAVVDLGRALGLDTSEIDGSYTPQTEEEREARARQDEEATAILEQRRAEAEAAMEEDRAARKSEAWVVWDRAKVIEDSVNPAWQYLQTRIGLWPRGPRAGTIEDGDAEVWLDGPGRVSGGWTIPVTLPACIRCLPDVEAFEFEYKGGSIPVRGPALVACKSDQVGEFVGIQIIPLGREKDGRVVKRAKVDRWFVGKDKPFYGPSKDDEGRPTMLVLPGDRAGGIIAVVEGLETGWAVRAATGWPVLVMFDAGGVAAIELDVGTLSALRTHTVVFAGDHDDNGVGKRAAEAGARRLAEAHPHLAVRVAIPDEERWLIQKVAAGVGQQGEVRE